MRSRYVPLLLLGTLVLTPSLALAQAGRSQANQRVISTPTVDVRADDVRGELRELLQRYPPALGRVLKLDPTLMTNQAYLTPYPALSEFLQRNPQVPHNASYFLNFVDIESSYGYRQPTSPELQAREAAINMWRNTLGDLMAFMVFLVVTFAIVWLVKYIVNHRRWLRATKLQSDVNSRLLERFSSNEELLAYLQSPTGSQLAKTAPIIIEPSPSVTAPFNRILWSVQAGLVLASAGVGFLFIKQHVMEEVAQLLLTLGVLGISVGIGFALAALASWVLSAKLGLLEQKHP